MVVPTAGHRNAQIRMLKVVDTRSLLAKDAWRHGLVCHNHDMQRRKGSNDTCILVDHKLKAL